MRSFLKKQEIEVEVGQLKETKESKASENVLLKPKQAEKNEDKGHLEKMPKKNKALSDGRPSYESLSLLEKAVLDSIFRYESKHYSGTIHFSELFNGLSYLGKAPSHVRQAVDSCVQRLLLIEDKHRSDYFILSPWARKLSELNIEKMKLERNNPLKTSINLKPRSLRKRVKNLKNMTVMADNIENCEKVLNSSENLLKVDSMGLGPNEVALMAEIKEQTNLLRERIEHFKGNNGPLSDVKEIETGEANAPRQKKPRDTEGTLEIKSEIAEVLEAKKSKDAKTDQNKKKRATSEAKSKSVQTVQAHVTKSSNDMKARSKKRKVPDGANRSAKKIKMEATK